MEVLCNPGLTNDNFDRLWTLLDKYLRTEVEADAERLFHRLADHKNIVTIEKGSSKRKYIRDKILVGDGAKNWMNYWRGGNSKGTKYTNSKRQNMFTEVGGITDYPMAPIGKKSVVLFFEDGVVERNSLWFIKKMEDMGDGMLKITANIINIVDGNIHETAYQGTQHVNQFFKFILPEDRGPDGIAGVCDICGEVQSGFGTEDEAMGDMVEHILREHDIPEGDENNHITLKITSAPKWKGDGIFLFTDKNPPKGKKVPPWRFTFEMKDLMKILKVYLSRKPVDLLLRIWGKEPFEVWAPSRKNSQIAKLEPYTIYQNINQERLWTDKLIDNVIQDMIVNYGPQIIGDFNNMGWTQKMLDISLLKNEDELKPYNLTMNSLEVLRNGILSKDNLPTWYIYKLFEISLDKNILMKARNYRMRPEMIAKYNEYLDGITG